MRWWSNRGPHTSDRQTEAGELLRKCTRRWGQRVCHVWDRGFASRRWLDEVLARHLRFVLRCARPLPPLRPRTSGVVGQRLATRAGAARLGCSACCGMPVTTASGGPACWPFLSGAPTTSPTPGRCGSWSLAGEQGTNPGTC